MGQVIGPRPQEKYIPGKPNTVRSVAEVRTLVVAYTDGQGRQDTCMLYSFGKMEDGQPGVFLIADGSEMRDKLITPKKPILEAARRYLLNAAEVEAKDVPASEVDSMLGDALSSEENG